ncbi:cold-shock protein [Paenibacillus athensensis]|uniref:Cold-inducible protein YdjO n=1 Tax=Paenibacillus athensensis TaxID=1967502 RepID=A0A4Y8PZG7_9BACL|nr:cold-shock protein [Paenibacillus athensensis]MCD1258571.1 cold-shock protein [Paenibacillus athensensis]
MYFNARNKYFETLPVENTPIWLCTKEGCKGWMRDNFTFDYQPVCCLCSSPMASQMKMLPLLVNSNDDLKSIKKGIQIKSAR